MCHIRVMGFIVFSGQFSNYRPKRSFGQGNIFTSICHSFCSQGGGGVSGPGGCSSKFSGGEVFLQIFGGVLPNFRGGSGPGGRFLQISGGSSKFSEGGVFLQIFGGDLHWNKVNVWPVRILLECILVCFISRLSYRL